jgi:hypothetical protein
MRRIGQAMPARARLWLAPVLALSMSFGAFTPAAANAGVATVAALCAQTPQLDTCDDDLGRILQQLLVAQSQLIQEEEEHPPRDCELATQLAHMQTPPHPEPLLLEGEDLSPALLRPPRQHAA